MIIFTGTIIVIFILAGSIYQIKKCADAPSNGEVETLRCIEDKINQDPWDRRPSLHIKCRTIND